MVRKQADRPGALRAVANGALLAAVGVTGLAVGAMPVIVASAAPSCATPQVSGVTVQEPSNPTAQPRQYGSAGATVNVTGSSFAGPGCTLEVSVGGLAPQPADVTATSFHFQTVAGMSGQLAVSLVDGQQQAVTDDHLVYITTPPATVQLSNTTPYTSQPVAMNGSGFDFHLPAGWEQLGATYAWTYPPEDACPAPPAQAPSLVDDTHIQLPMPAQYCSGRAAVTLSAPLDSANTGPADPRMSFVLSDVFNIAPRIDGMSPNPAQRGQTVTVSGSGFGGSPGAVSVHGTEVSAASWTDTSVRFTVPSGITSGHVNLVRWPDGLNFSAGTLTVDTAAPSPHSPAVAHQGGPSTINAVPQTGGSPSHGGSAAPSAATYGPPQPATSASAAGAVIARGTGARVPQAGVAWSLIACMAGLMLLLGATFVWRARRRVLERRP
jgi:hypothetical protein